MQMDYMEKISELRAQKSQLVDQAQTLATDGKFEEVDKVTAQMEGINTNIQSLEKLMDASRKNAVPENHPDDSILHDKGGEPIKGEKKGLKVFDSLGEQLQAIYKQTKGLAQDKRLMQVNDDVLGTSTITGPDGGFALQTDFAGTILESAVQKSPLLNRLDRYVVSNPSNSARWLRGDETDVSESVFGGIMMYWAAEGASVKASKPQFNEVKMDLEKMMGIAYCTDEMLQDVAFMSGFFGNAFSLASDRLLAGSVISGDGVGKPLGYLKSGALISVDKETDQVAKTFVGDNAIKMQARSMPRNRDRLVWVMHPDVEEQLPYLHIESGNAAKFLWNPEGGLGNFDTQRVLNKPVLFDDNCSAVGSLGDVTLIDPLQYILLVKGTAKQDWSIHVEFLTDQQCFRMVMRCNGAPKINKPLKIKNSTKLRSPFIGLAARG